MLHERQLHFPPDLSLGILRIVNPGDVPPPWDPAYVPPIAAQGTMRVPAGKVVRLHLRLTDLPNIDLSSLRQLAADSLNHLSIDCCHLPDAELRHLTHLTGLASFSLMDTFTTDAGLMHIGKSVGLESLHLHHVPVSDAGVMHVRLLTKLRLLTLVSTEVTPDGVRWLNKVLPDSTVQYAPPRPPRYRRRT